MQDWLKILEENNYVAVKKHVKSGANLQESNDHDESVLALAIKMKCDHDIIDLLIENGADIFHLDDEGVSILDFAIAYNNHDIVKRLIEQGFDINKTHRKSGFTPAMAAVCYNRYEILKTLIEKKADLNSRDTSGFTAYTFAKKMRKQKMMDILIENGSPQ